MGNKKFSKDGLAKTLAIAMIIDGILIAVLGIVFGVIHMGSPDDLAVASPSVSSVSSRPVQLDEGKYQIWYVNKYGEYDIIESNEPGTVTITTSTNEEIGIMESDYWYETEYEEWVKYGSFHAPSKGSYNVRATQNAQIYITTPYTRDSWAMPAMIGGCVIGFTLLMVGFMIISKQKQKQAALKAGLGTTGAFAPASPTSAAPPSGANPDYSNQTLSTHDSEQK